MQRKFGTEQDYQRLATSVSNFGAVINDAITYCGTKNKVRIGDLVVFPSDEDNSIMYIGAVFGAGYGGWASIDQKNPENITVSVVLLDGSLHSVPIEKVHKKS